MFQFIKYTPSNVLWTRAVLTGFLEKQDRGSRKAKKGKFNGDFSRKSKLRTTKTTSMKQCNTKVT